MGSVVVQREPCLLERLQVAPDRPRRHAAERREFVERRPAATRTLNFAENGPLPDDFGISRHEPILAIGEGGSRARTVQQHMEYTLWSVLQPVSTLTSLKPMRSYRAATAAALLMLLAAACGRSQSGPAQAQGFPPAAVQL